MVLAAGAGRRMGRPKALMADDAGSWLARAAHLALTSCDRVVVVLGAAAGEAASLLPDDPRIVRVIAEDWSSGISASLRAGLAAAARAEPPIDAVAITLVDLPHLRAEAFERLAAPGIGPGVLRRAVFGGRPGHPVLIGRRHWEALAASLSGDQGASRYLTANGAEEVDCTGLGGEADVDTA